MKVNFKKLNKFAKVPTRADEGSAGYDLYCAESHPVLIAPGKTEKISTGIAMELPEGTFGGIFARSGLATKKGLRLANSVGVIDSSYRGEIIVALHNDSNIIQSVARGERIAQLIILKYTPLKFKEVNELTETERGDGGFGHTGD